VSTADLVGSIRALRARLPLAGASLTEFSPSSPDAAVDDLGTILRIVGALA
jgi:arginase